MEYLIETLSDHVHQAWMKEKLRQGFADHPRSVDESGRGCCTAEMHHTDMLPYADLPESIKDYDRVTVRAVLAGIESAGYRLWPKT